MRYLFVNSVYGVRSTGKLIARQCASLRGAGHVCAVAYGREAVPDDTVELYRIGSPLDYCMHGVRSRLFDAHGFGSRRATTAFLRWAEAWKPDVIWLHNLHGYYIQVELLFAWLKRHPEIEVRWTLHDCWAFTGHCVHFTAAGCEQWRTGCKKCVQLRTYPRSFLFGNVRRNYRRKQAAFTGVANLRLYTPSRWLAELTRQSFLAEYPVTVAPNRIDTDLFYPRKSDWKDRLGIAGRYLVLGVAVGWEETKGIQDLIALYEALDDRFAVVVVGALTGGIRSLPDGMIHLERTGDQNQLAELYSAADVFVNPTHQDTYPTVNLEARACGTPVVTYHVGGSPESASPSCVVPEGDIAALAAKIRETVGADERK